MSGMLPRMSWTLPSVPRRFRGTREHVENLASPVSDCLSIRITGLFQRARSVIPGGSIRRFVPFAGSAEIRSSLQRRQGAFLIDADGHRYIDYVALGTDAARPRPPEIIAAIVAAAGSGTSFGARLSRWRSPSSVGQCHPCSACALVSSGTEATMSALRPARGFTGRHKIVRSTAPTGHADPLLVAARLGGNASAYQARRGHPGAAQDTLTVAWNDLPAMQRLFAEHRDEHGQSTIAALIVEPVCGNMGCVPPRPG